MARGETVEIELGADLAVLVLEVRDGIDAEHFDDQLGDVLDVGLEHHGLVGAEPDRVVPAPREIDPLAELGGARRPEGQGRLVGVAIAVEQARGRDLGVEPAPVDPRGELVGLIDPLVEEVADERLVVAGRSQARDRAEVAAELRDVVTVMVIDPRARDVVGGARELEVGREQPGVDGRAPAPARVEEVPQQVRLERVDRGGEVRDEPPHLLEERVATIAIEIQIDDAARRDHPPDHRGGPAEVTAEVGDALAELVELLER